jgi:putative transposase
MNTLIGQLKAKDAGRRKDWMKKTTTDLACRLDVIRVENLSITAMTRSARGCCPGTGQAGLPTRPLHPRFGSS